MRSGLIGRSIEASRSPWLHEEEARALGLELTYELFDFDARRWPDDRLRPLLEELTISGYRGVNVTYPFKQAVVPLLDAVSPSAAAVGAVNTIVIRNGLLTGHNTDMEGFRDSVVGGLADAAMGTVWQVGAGGAGAAVASALLSLGVGELLLSDVDPTRATALAERLATHFGPGRARPFVGPPLHGTMIDGLVNATPMGMAAHPEPPFDPDQITGERWVADIVYFPLETRLLRLARERGCRTLDGSGMVISQAARAFHLITGAEPDVERMRDSFVSPHGR